MKKILFTFTLLVLMGAVGHSVEVGFYPGLDELIEKADAIVILRIGRPVTDFGSPALYSTHDCYIYQTLKGDIPANTMVRLQLLDTRTQFVPPYALLSTHLMFLTKKRSPDEPTEYRTLEYLGSNVRLSPFGHEKMPEGKTIRDRIISDIARTIAYNEKQHEQEQAFLNRMIQGAEETLAGRPISWAQPMEVEGVPNLHRVSPDLYRIAQPTSEGMRNLKRMGIETIVNLRSFHSDRDEIGKTDLQCERIHMKAWHPERDEAVRFLRIVMDPKRTPRSRSLPAWRGPNGDDVRPLPHRGARLD